MVRYRYADRMWGELIALAIVLLLLAAYLVFKGAELVVRTVSAHPSCRPLQLALGAAVLATLAAVAYGSQAPVLTGLAAASVAGLVLVSRCVELYYDPLQQRRVSREALIDDVLHNAWW